MFKSLLLSSVIVLFAPATVAIANPTSPSIALYQIQETRPKCDPKLPQSRCPHRRDNNWFTWTTTSLPYIVSPRMDRLMNSQPLLRWLPAEDATSYAVSLHDVSGTEIWSATTSETQIQYPGEPVLQPGGIYEVVVKADTGASSANERLKESIAFTVLTTAEREEIQTLVAQETSSDPTTRTLNIANLYVSRGLVNEAIALLEEQWQTEPNAALAARLGNLYFGWLRLVQPAEGYYQQALELATDESLERAVTLQQLGYVESVKNDPEQAIAFWEAAIAVYEGLGDRAAVEKLRDAIHHEQY